MRAALGTRRDPRTGHWLWAVASETTIRRTLARLDAEALAAAIGAPRPERDSWRPAQTAFEQHPDTSVLLKGRAAMSTTPSTQEARAIIQVAAGGVTVCRYA